MRITPVIKRIRGGKPESLKEFARVAKDVKTDNLSIEEIASHIKTITGEELEEIGLLSGRDVDNIEEARWCLHAIIVYANEYGQPKGQDLGEEDLAVPGPSSVPESQVQQKSSGKRKRDDSVDLENRISHLEKTANLKTDLVDNLKEKVRTLSLQQDPSDSLILLTLDELSRVTRKTGHEEADVFDELARQANRYSSKLDISSLCLSVLGGKVVDVITKAVSRCLKEKQSNEKIETKDKRSDNATKREDSPLASLYPQVPQIQYMPSASFQPPFFPFFNPGMHGTYRNNRRGGYGGYRPRGSCLFCEAIHIKSRIVKK